jgi:predicted SnoaL-like aldol condensation-catalyzing enzyme
MEITRRTLVTSASAALAGVAALSIGSTAAHAASSTKGDAASTASSTGEAASAQSQQRIDAALALINTFATGDAETASSLLAEGYIQHNLACGTGRDAFVASVQGLAAADAPTLVANVRAFADGDYVFLQSIYDFAGAGERVGFDVFRFEGDLIAEHWDNLAQLSKPNLSLHTQYDGQREARDLDKTEANRELVKNFLFDVMQGNNSDKTPQYFNGDAYIQHNVAMGDGVSGLSAALQSLAEQGIQMVYATTHMVLAEGDMVLAVSEGTYGDVPTAYYDLWRVEDGFIAEHWDVMETIPDESTWANDNGKF